MLVLLEGVDGGGKSHLAEKLVETHAATVRDEGSRAIILHKGQPTPGLDAFQEYEMELEEPELHNLICSTTDLVVMDRWHAGEVPYGKLYRNHSRLTDAGMLHVELTLSALGAFKLLVQPEYASTVLRRLVDRGDDFLQLEHAAHVHGWYADHGSKFFYHRASGWSPEFILRAAASIALDGDPLGVRHWPGYIGPGSPIVILVGDERGPNKLGRAAADFPRAFTPWDNAGSSVYLLNALLISGLSHAVGVVNAHEPGVDLSKIHKFQIAPSVVALGNRASITLTKAGIEHQKVPHPQWWKRFRHAKITEYAELIKEAAGWK